MVSKREEREANWTLVGGLSKPSKMPGYAYGLPARACITGQKLAKVFGSVCRSCYACKGCYQFKSTQEAQARRLAALADLPAWTEAMIRLIGDVAVSSGVFRWHDSGDLQSEAHLDAIMDIAEALPHIQFWLPTKEVGMVSAVTTRRATPSNLTIRVSAFMVGAKPHKSYKFSSMVLGHGQAVPQGVHLCPAPDQGGKCGSCRACWSQSVQVVAYRAH